MDNLRFFLFVFKTKVFILFGECLPNDCDDDDDDHHHHHHQHQYHQFTLPILCFQKICINTNTKIHTMCCITYILSQISWICCIAYLNNPFSFTIDRALKSHLLRLCLLPFPLFRFVSLFEWHFCFGFGFQITMMNFS